VSYGEVVSYVFPGMLLLKIAHWEICSLRPSGDQSRRLVNRAIVDHQPFKIVQRLRAQTVEHAVKRMRTVISRCKNRENWGIWHRRMIVNARSNR
jgi:hypothetical protein